MHDCSTPKYKSEVLMNLIQFRIDDEEYKRLQRFWKFAKENSLIPFPLSRSAVAKFCYFQGLEKEEKKMLKKVRNFPAIKAQLVPKIKLETE